MYRITKPFKYSINGYEVTAFEPDEYPELDADVIRYAESIGALEGSEERTTYPDSDHGQEEDGPAVCRDPNITQPAEGKKKGRKH